MILVSNLIFIQNNEENRNSSKSNDDKCQFTSKENSLNEPVDWQLSIVSLLSGAFELTAFEHSRCRPSRKLNYFLPSFCFRGISASGAPNLRLRFHQSFQFCARFAHYSNPFLPSSSTACTFRSVKSFPLSREIERSISSISCII